jgi:predicted transcriptional regulator
MANKTNQTTAEAIANKERVRKAIELRVQGFSLDEVAGELGWNSPQAASKAIKTALNKAVIEDATAYKILQIQRLEKAIAKVLEKAEKGNLFAVRELVRLSKRLSELVGCDAPSKFAETDIKGNDKPKVIVYLPDNNRNAGS